MRNAFSRVYNVQYVLCPIGLRFNVALSSDLQEACALGYESDYIDVYSNSWGPADSGFLVQGPGKLVEKALETGAKKVCHSCHVCCKNTLSNVDALQNLLE